METNFVAEDHIPVMTDKAVKSIMWSCQPNWKLE